MNIDFYLIGVCVSATLALALSGAAAAFGLMAFWQTIEAIFKGYNANPYWHIPKLYFNKSYKTGENSFRFWGWNYRALIFGITQITPIKDKPHDH